MNSASFSSFEEVYENLDDFDDFDEEAKSSGPHLLATCAARSQARSLEGAGSSPATMEASSSAVEELQIVSEIAVDGSQDASCASERGPPAPASCGIAASAVQDVKGCHTTKEDAEGKQCQAEEEEEDDYDDCGKKLRGDVGGETDGIQREKGEKCTDIQQEDEKREEFFFEEEEEEEEEGGGGGEAESGRDAAKIEADDLCEELELLIRGDEELCKFQSGQQQQQQQQQQQGEERNIQQVEDEMEEEETRGPRWALNRFLDGVEASMHRADDVEKKIEGAVSRHVLDPVEGVIDSAGGGVEEGSGMRKVATAIERTLEPVEDAIDSIENWVGGFVNTRVSPVLSWAAAWGDRRVQQLESYLDVSPSSMDPEVPIALPHRQQHVHAQ